MDDLQDGERLLGIIERLVDDPDELIGRVEAVRRAVHDSSDDAGRSDEAAIAAERLIATYANKAALVGGLTAAVGTFPGVGTVLALAGGTLADVALTMKYEVEMALCLTHLYGHDIRGLEARRFGYLLASVGTYEVNTGRSAEVELARLVDAPVRRRVPQQAGKLLLTAMSRLALRRSWKGLLRAVPLVGVVFSASANKVLTTTVGHHCLAALEAGQAPLDDLDADEPVVDARLTE